MRRRTIVLSVPNNNPSHVIYLPTIWVNLKTYCSTHSRVVDEAFSWLEPIIFKGAPEELLRPYGDTPIDVLGLSCYSWNTKTNMALARHVRSIYPHCLIVAGGPDLSHRRPDFFAEHPYLDAMVLKDGEVPFLRILEQVAADRLDLDTIPGLVLPASGQDRPPERTARPTRPPVLPDDLGPSPWLANADAIEELMARLRRERPGIPIGIPWEIDRGCPYNCTFCDWGSNTNSKVRLMDLERLRQEAMWISKNRIHVTFMTVANFGMFPRDTEVLEYIIEAKRTYGFPRIFIWNNAKNNVDRVADMNRRAFEAGLVDFHILSVQSLDPDVLATMGRKPLDMQHLARVAERAKNRGIPCVAQLIFGAPGDNLEKFVGSLTGLMEMGVHDEYVAYPFELLPNAPASDPAYLQRWGIRAVTRRGSVNKRRPDDANKDSSTIIVATSSYAEAEFVDMYTQGRLIVALHNGGVTQFIARYLRRASGISYFDFYWWLIEEMFAAPEAPWQDVYRRCHDHITAYIGAGGEDNVESLSLAEVPELGYQLNVEEYFLFKLMTGLDDFYNALAPQLTQRFGELPKLACLLRFQRGVMLDHNYDARQGRVLELAHDWPRYFSDPDQADSREPVSGPCRLPVDATTSGSQHQYQLDWHELASNPPASLRRWVERIIGKHYQRVQRSYVALDTMTAGTESAPTAGGVELAITAGQAVAP
jgi:putative methyltransferase